MNHAHIHFGLAQRSNGTSLRMRWAYQRCVDYEQDGFLFEFSRDAVHHRATVVLAPPHADAGLFDPAVLREAIVARERRKDAQEARTLEISLPRAIPEGLEMCLGAWAHLPLAAMGACLQLDLHCPPAEDGLPNPHLHSYATMRACEGAAFGRKRRDWNRAFWLAGGRCMRAMLASRIVAACGFLGLAVCYDVRRKSFWSPDPPEPRVPPWAWRDAELRERFPGISELRRLRDAEDRSESSDVDARLSLSNPVYADAEPWERLEMFRVLVEGAERLGFSCFPNHVEMGDPFVLRCGSTVIAVDADQTIAMASERPKSHDWRTLAALLAAASWPALIAEGRQDDVDALAIWTAPNGLAPINYPLGPTALARLQARGVGSLLRDLAPCDRDGAIARGVPQGAHAPGPYDDLVAALNADPTQRELADELADAKPPDEEQQALLARAREIGQKTLAEIRGSRERIAAEGGDLHGRQIAREWRSANEATPGRPPDSDREAGGFAPGGGSDAADWVLERLSGEEDEALELSRRGSP